MDISAFLPLIKDGTSLYIQSTKRNNKAVQKEQAEFRRMEQERLKERAVNTIERVIFNDPATIVIWKDGSKTVVKAGPHDVFDPEKGLAIACMKKMFGNGTVFHAVLKAYLPEAEDGCNGETCSLEKYLK